MAWLWVRVTRDDSCSFVFPVSWHNLEYLGWKPESFLAGWPLSMSMGNCLDCYLIWADPTGNWRHYSLGRGSWTLQERRKLLRATNKQRYIYIFPLFLCSSCLWLWCHQPLALTLPRWWPIVSPRNLNHTKHLFPESPISQSICHSNELKLKHYLSCIRGTSAGFQDCTTLHYSLVD